MVENTSKTEYSRIALFGDSDGISELLKYVPMDNIACFVCASIRPQYIKALKSLSGRNHIPLFIQPKYNTPSYKDFLEKLKAKQIDLILCNSYSMIIRKEVMDLVGGEAVNVHYALLPKNRGPNPVQWALIKGDKVTGVSIHYMSDKIDAGDIIKQKKVPISMHDSWVTLIRKCRDTSRELMKITIPLILAKKNKRISQYEKEATVNYRLTPEYPRLRFSVMSDKEIFNIVRAQVKPLKGAFIELNKRRIYFKKMITMSDVKKLKLRYAE